MTTRITLRRDLSDLKQKVYELGEKCIEVSDLYNSLLDNYSSSFANRLEDLKIEIKNECKNLHDQCFLVLTLQQPLIKDLRFVIGSLQTVINLEKITEQYINASIILSSFNLIQDDIQSDFIQLSSQLQELLKNSLLIYLSCNITASDSIYKLHSQINVLHDLLYKKVLNQIAKEMGEKAQIEALFLSTIRTLEKISDLTVNIPEQVSYIIEGRK